MLARLVRSAGSNASRVSRIALIAAVLAVAARETHAAPLAAHLGADVFASSDGQRTRALVGVVAVPIGRGDVVGGLTGFDSPAGTGGAWLAGGGLTVAPGLQLRVLAAFVAGPAERRARRFHVGPRYLGPRGAMLALSYTRDEERDVDPVDGVLGEASLPFARALAARGVLGCAASRSGARGARATAGLAWNPFRHLELTADVGVAQSAIASTAGPLPGTRDRLPGTLLPAAVPRGAESAPGGSSLAFTSAFGIRFPFP